MFSLSIDGFRQINLLLWFLIKKNVDFSENDHLMSRWGGQITILLKHAHAQSCLIYLYFFSDMPHMFPPPSPYGNHGNHNPMKNYRKQMSGKPSIDEDDYLQPQSTIRPSPYIDLLDSGIILET